MTRRRLIVLVVLALAAAAVVVAVARASRPPTPSPPVERALQEAVVRYRIALQPVRPPELYGETLTPRRCIMVMRAYERAVKAAADGEAAEHADSYHALQLLLWNEAVVDHDRPGALPVAWEGEVVYWRVLDGGGDRYRVRAAVYETCISALWDPEAGRLSEVRRRQDTDAQIYEYTVARSGGTWKVLDHDPWFVRQGTVEMHFIDGAVVEVGPA